MHAAVLDDRSATAEIDRRNMLQVLEDTPETYEQTYAAALYSKSLPRSLHRVPSRVVFVGMGGSGIAGDILKDWLFESDVPIEVVKGPRLPGSVTKNACVLAASYSGQTFETLKVLNEARRRKSTVGCVASGGVMLEICRKKGIPHIEVTGGLQPRAALPCIFSASLVMLERWGICSRRTTRAQSRAATEQMRELRKTIGFASTHSENPAKQLAVQLLGRIPFVYASEFLASVGRRFKNQLNENSKVLAKCEVLPEILHNEIESWRMLKEGHFADSTSFVFLRGSKEEAEMFERLMCLIRESGGKTVHEIYLNSSAKLSGLLASIYYCDYVSFYLAIARGVDPTPVDAISSFKSRRPLRD